LRLFTVFLLLLTALPALPQNVPPRPQTELDVSEPLFVVMSAAIAGGFEPDLDSPTNHKLRKALSDHFKAQQNLESVIQLRRFVRDHHLKNPAAEYSQYIIFGLLLSNPPDFTFKLDPTALPPELISMEGLTPLLVQFYREAKIEELWKQLQPTFEQELGPYQAPIARAALEVNAYLRNQTSGYLGRHFQVLIDLLGPPNQVQTRSFLDDYYVVVTPSAEMPVDEIRHMYLHYVLDTLPLKFSKVVDEKRGLIDYAQGSPILEEQFKSDFNLLTTECLIKAIESRMDKKPGEVEEALREGYVVTPALAEALVGYEAQEQAMRLYFPDLIRSIDLRKEARRLDHVDFLSERPGRRVRTVTKEVKPAELTGPEKTLASAEKLYAARDLPHARETYLEVLKETQEKPIHAKAYYGLARIAVLERDPELGDRLFRKVLELDPDDYTKSWSLLYLGRLADSQQRHDEAVEHYKAALAIAGAPDSVRNAAEQGLKQAFKK
jgi:tetratricopeptide (TPR) repeat protein